LIQRRKTVADSLGNTPLENKRRTRDSTGAAGGTGGNWNIELLLDVELPISVSFGNSEMQLRDVLKLGPGSVIELDKSVNDPVLIIVNHKPIAKGEVVMVDGNYGVRILEVESTADRIRSLGT
jgi:flagellar motor switch protein FliN/FliY